MEESREVVSRWRKNGSVLLVFVSDDVSSDMKEVWSDREVINQMKCHRCELIQLSVGSGEYIQFADQYPVTALPSLFCINHKGLPVDILHGVVNSAHLLEWINKAIKISQTGTCSTSLKVQQSLEKNSSLTRTVHTNSFTNDTVQKQKTQVNVTLGSQNGRHIVSRDTSTSGKVEMKPNKKQVELTTMTHPTMRQRSSHTGTCKLQLKIFPTDNKIIQQFNSLDQLSRVKQFVSEKLNVDPKILSLERSYPKYVFSADDYCKSLTDLQLTPSAIVIVKTLVSPSNRSLVKNTTQFAVSLLIWLLWPLQLLFSFLSQLLGNSQSQTSSSTANQQQSSSYSYEHKRTGDMSSLRQDDDDDDLNTYNGNSTQQQ